MQPSLTWKVSSEMDLYTFLFIVGAIAIIFAIIFASLGFGEGTAFMCIAIAVCGVVGVIGYSHDILSDTPSTTQTQSSSKYLSEELDESTLLQSVTFSPDGGKEASGTYTVVTQDGKQASYSTKLDNFEVTTQQSGEQHIDKLTVTEDGSWGKQTTKQITRLYVTLQAS